jgi:hypothetical protein
MSRLPGVLAEVQEAVAEALGDPAAGERAALALARARGGRRAFIPVRARDDHWIVQALGRPAAEAVMRHFRGGSAGAELDIPLGPVGTYKQQRAERARAMDQALKAGLSANEAAAQVGVTRRSVYKARERLGSSGKGAQRDLFGDDDAA